MSNLNPKAIRLNVPVTGDLLYLIDEMRKARSPLPSRSALVRQLIIERAAADRIKIPPSLKVPS